MVSQVLGALLISFKLATCGNCSAFWLVGCQNPKRLIRVCECGGYYAIIAGILGLIVGLVLMLQNLDDPSALGPGMAVAVSLDSMGCLLISFLNRFKRNLHQPLMRILT